MGDGECVTLIGLRPNEWGGEYYVGAMTGAGSVCIYYFNIYYIRKLPTGTY